MPAITFSGLASGIDADSIIKTLADARRLANAPLETRIQENLNENTALEELSTMLATLQGSLEDFMTLSGGVFTKTVTSSDAETISGTASSNAAAGTTVISDVSIARAATFTFDQRFSAADEPVMPDLSSPAIISISVGTGDDQTTVEVEVDSETTLIDISGDINSQLAGHVSSSVVNTGTADDPQYALLISGQRSGSEEGSIEVTVDPVLDVFQAFTLSQAKDATFVIEGLGQISRPSNQISDLLPGLTLDLKQDTAGPIILTVGNDNSKTAEKISAAVEAFNAVVGYVTENNKVERIETENGVTNVFGTLAKGRIDDNILTTLRNAWSSANSGIEDSSVRIFADLGISTQRDGTLTFDAEKFEEAAGKDAQAVGNLLQDFADRAASTEGVIEQFNRFKGFKDLAIEANETENSSLNDRISRVERSIAQQEESMRRVFGNLEATISRLNQQGAALQSILGAP